MAIETFADVGLVRISQGNRPVGAGFVMDDRHIVTCAHVVNASLGLAPNTEERPDTVGPVAVRVGGDWIPVDVTLTEWIPLTEDKRGDVAVLEMTAGRPDGVNAVPLRRPQQSVDHRFAVQGFPDGTLIAATGWIRTRLTISQEWVQLEDDKVPGRAVTEGFSVPHLGHHNKCRGRHGYRQRSNIALATALAVKLPMGEGRRGELDCQSRGGVSRNRGWSGPTQEGQVDTVRRDERK